jgi:lipooligosaccharide transport system permease protein
MVGFVRVVQRNAIVYRQVWRGSLFSSFLQPTLFLLAMGIGVGQLVNRGGAVLPGGVSFLQFLAPGLLASSCMQTASFESSFPITAKMTWQRNYEAMTATPLGVIDLVLGELAWLAVRITTVAVAFAIVVAAFGVLRSPRGLLAIPAAVLTGVACGAPLMAYAATLKNGSRFNVVFRFVITPLFLFSGVFFPLTRLPRFLQTVAWFTPLFHGVELTRGLVLGTLDPVLWPLHVLYLVVLTAVGAGAALWTFRRKLEA